MATFGTNKPEMGGGASALLDAGSYSFEVADVKALPSKNGNEMIELKLRVGDAFVWDNLVWTERAFWKVSQFLKSIDMFPGEGVQIGLDKTGGSFTYTHDGQERDLNEWIGCKGGLELVVESYKANDGTFKKRNKVKTFTWEEF